MRPQNDDVSHENYPFMVVVPPLKMLFTSDEIDKSITFMFLVTETIAAYLSNVRKRR